MWDRVNITKTWWGNESLYIYVYKNENPDHFEHQLSGTSLFTDNIDCFNL